MRGPRNLSTAPLSRRWKHFKDCRGIDSINPMGVDDLSICVAYACFQNVDTHFYIYILPYVYKSAYADIEIIRQVYGIAETYFSLELQWYWI